MSVGIPAGRPRAAHLGPHRRGPQVLDAALEIAHERGVAAVTIGAVADRLDVTRPVVYSCFADRVELIRALVDRENDVMLGEVLAALRPEGSAAGEAGFVAGFQALLDVVARRPASWRLVMNADPDPAVADYLRAGRAVVADRFAALLAPALTHWGTVDAERKLPVLVEQFMSSCEAAVRTLLDDVGHDWTPQSLGAFIGPVVYRGFRAA